VSTAKLEDKGLFWDSESRSIWKRDPQTKRKITLALGDRKNGLYAIESTSERAPCYGAAAFSTQGNPKGTPELRRKILRGSRNSRRQYFSTASLDVWHSRMGHIRKDALLNLPKAVEGVKLSSQSFERASELCESCALGHMTANVSRKPNVMPPYAFHTIAFDIIPFREQGEESSPPKKRDAEHNEWILHMVDPYSGYHQAHTWRGKKTEALILWWIKDFLKRIKRWGFTTQILQSDNEPALGNEWKNFLRSTGIMHKPSAPDTQGQNGLPERAGRSLVTTARKSFIDSKLPEHLWGYFIKAAVRVLNETPIERKGWITPHQIVYGKKPDCSGARIPGSLVYVLRKGKSKLLGKNARLHKFKSVSFKGWYLGRSASNIFEVWIPEVNKVIYTRDALIDEKVRYSPEPKETNDGIPVNELIGELQELDIFEMYEALYEQALDEEEFHPDSGTFQTIQRESYPTPRPEGQPDGNAQAPPDGTEELLRSAQDSLDEQQPATPDESDNEETQGGTLSSELLKASRPQAFWAHSQPQGHMIAAFMTAMREKPKQLSRGNMPLPPKSWKQLKQHPFGPGFHEAADTEYKGLWDKGTFTKVRLTAEEAKDVIPLKWVFTDKFDEDGQHLKHKARICVRGDLQKDPGHDLYAATGAYRTFRILLALVAAFDLDLEQVDVTNAFVNAFLKDLVYVHYPPGYKKQANEYLQLKRALYGLKISPKLWFEECSSTLKGLGFIPCSDEPCLMINKETGVIIFFYVDDFLIAAPKGSKTHVDQLKKVLDTTYGIRDFGPAKHFLNVRILRNRKQRKLWILQDEYINKITEKFHLTYAKRPRTPLTPNHQLKPQLGASRR
jgi:hypothetical protein